MLVLIVLVFVGVQCDNVTDKWLTQSSDAFKTRQNRLLTFNTNNDQISIELAFNVPFLTIPVKPTMDGALGNINVGAVILGGVMIFGVAVAIPGLLFLLSSKVRRRSADQNQLWGFLKTLDEAFKANEIDANSCMQKGVCELVKKSFGNLERGEDSSMDRLIIDSIKSTWVRDFIGGTSWEVSIQKGTSGESCQEYECNISESLKEMEEQLKRLF